MDNVQDRDPGYNVLADRNRPYPDQGDDDAMDRAWAAEQQRRDDEADAEQASAAMADVSAELAADAGPSTSAIIASGAVAAVDAIAALFTRKIG